MTFSSPHAQKYAWTLWLFFFAVVTVWSLCNGELRTVTYVYNNAALNWLHGLSLYNLNTRLGTGFIYFPQSAIANIPLSYFPPHARLFLWQFISLSVYVYALLRLARFYPTDMVPKVFLTMTLIAIPLAFSSTRNGQMNLWLAATMMLAMSEIAYEKWSLASLWLVIGFALKPTMIVSLLLTACVYQQLRWRLLIGLSIMFLFPFMTQHYSYVISQYAQCIQMLQDAAHLGESSPEWAQPFSALQKFDLAIPDLIQTITRVTAALGTLYLAYHTKKTHSHKEAALIIFALAACYLMLFNPRTENNDYVILAPAIGYFLSRVFLFDHNHLLSAFFIILTICIAGSYTVGNFLTPGNVSWLAPLMALNFGIFLVCRVFSNAQSRYTLN